MTVSPRTAALASALALAAVATAPATASAEDASDGRPTVVSVEQHETPIDGWNGWLVWSRRAADGRFALIARNPAGEGISLPVATQPTPIDASIGPGPDGQPLIVYTECSSPGPQPTGCDVYRLDPLTGNGGRVAAASRSDREERFPTVWGSKIAFSLSVGKSGRTAGVAVANLDGSAPKRPTVFGPRTERSGGKNVSVRTYGPRGIDLRGGRLAFSWQAKGRSDHWSLQTAGSKGSPRQLLSTRTTSTVVSQIGRPVVGPRDIVAPVLRTGGSSASSIVRSSFSGRNQSSLKGGFSAAQTARYGSALIAVARTDDRDLVVVRRLASDGRWACAAPTAPDAGGCELLRYADPSRDWTRLTSSAGSRR